MQIPEINTTNGMVSVRLSFMYCVRTILNFLCKIYKGQKFCKPNSSESFFFLRTYIGVKSLFHILYIFNKKTTLESLRERQ